MNKWKVTIILKSGTILKGIYESAKTDSVAVAKEMLPECKPTNVFGFQSEEGESVFVIATEVAAFKIGV